MGALTLGTAPDSWGVWFAEDPAQPPYERFLREVSESGFEWIELGAYGYLPTESGLLNDRLAAHRLHLTGGTAFADLHHDGGLERSWAAVEPIARLTAAAGARDMVVIPTLWRDEVSGRAAEDPALDAEQWTRLLAGHDELGRRLLDAYGIRQHVHPHADSHIRFLPEIERLLEETDPGLTGLCLDTGHAAYHGVDSLEILRRFGSRVGYLHVKQVHPEQARRYLEEDVWFTVAVGEGVIAEPPEGEPDLAAVLAAARALPQPMFAVAEHDLYPADLDVPLPLARRTHAYLEGLL